MNDDDLIEHSSFDDEESPEPPRPIDDEEYKSEIIPNNEIAIKKFSSSKDVISKLEMQLLVFRKIDEFQKIDGFLNDLLKDLKIEKIDKFEVPKKNPIKKDNFDETIITIKKDDLFNLIDDFEFLIQKSNNFDFVDKINQIQKKLEENINIAVENIKKQRTDSILDFSKKIEKFENIENIVKGIQSTTNSNNSILKTILQDDDVTLNYQKNQEEPHKKTNWKQLIVGVLLGVGLSSLGVMFCFSYLKTNDVKIGGYEIFISKNNRILN